MQRRVLDFTSIDEVIADLDRLEREGYTKLGKWDLAQACDHLGFYVAGSLDGFDFTVPWVVRALIGRPLLKRLLRTRGMGKGGPTVPKSVPPPGADEHEAVARFKALLERFRDHPGAYRPSPFFGALSRDEWRELHLIHGAHHLSFLVPNGVS